MYSKFFVAVASAVFLAFGLSDLKAAPPQLETAIVTSGEMCGGCAKKITAQFQKVPGVAQVRVDVATKTTVITPVDGAVLSPRALWEGMEAAGKKPQSLAGPNGVFSSKPRG